MIASYHKNFLFEKMLMMSLPVICGLGLPQSKILGTPMNWRLPEKLFFGEHLRLCSWSFALALSICVLGLERVCPQKGCPWRWTRIFFCVLGLEPCVLDSTSVNQYIFYQILIREPSNVKFFVWH